MLGFGKKKKPLNIFEVGIANNVSQDFIGEMPVKKRNPLANIPIYDDYYQRNTQIPKNILDQLPKHWQKYWYRLDFNVVNQYLDGKINSNLEPITHEAPESPDNPLSQVSRESEQIQDVIKISKERKDKLKAIAFGEIREEAEEQE